MCPCHPTENKPHNKAEEEKKAEEKKESKFDPKELLAVSVLLKLLSIPFVTLDWV